MFKCLVKSIRHKLKHCSADFCCLAGRWNGFVASGEYWQECLALVSNAFYIYLDLFCLVNLHKFKEIFELNKYSGKCGFVNFELKTSEFTEISVSKSAMHS